MKKVSIFSLSLLFCINYCCAQNSTSTPASFKKYGHYIRIFCEEYHSVNYKGELSKFKKDFHVLVKFCIDTTGKITNLVINGNDSLPIPVKDYASTLIFSTNGNWHPEIKDCKKILSDTITYLVLFRSKNIKDWERLEAMGKEFLDEKGIMLIDSNNVDKKLLLPKYSDYNLIRIEY